MMKFISRLVKRRAEGALDPGFVRQDGGLSYESLVAIDSKATPGVRFTIRRISFGRRMELSRRVLEISRKAEFLQAGTELTEKVEANILAHEVDVMYLDWGLLSIEGLMIDGEPATAARLAERGPEELAREVVLAIKEQCGLSEAERKN